MATTEDVLEDAATLATDVKDLTVESATEALTVVKHNPWLAIGAGVLGITVGFAVGYKYAEKKLFKGFEEHLQQQLDAARRNFEREVKYTNKYSTPAEAVKDLITEGPENAEAAAQTQQVIDETDRLLEEHGYIQVTEEVAVERNVFVNGQPMQDDFDYEREAALRSPEQPYVISHDEFLENLPEHGQVTITYYVGDDTLADERDEPITDIDYVVGTQNLAKFGYGSRDSNIVYVRNEKTDLDFEILRSEGKFAEEVLGYREDRSDERPQGSRRRGGD